MSLNPQILLNKAKYKRFPNIARIDWFLFLYFSVNEKLDQNKELITVINKSPVRRGHWFRITNAFFKVIIGIVLPPDNNTLESY